MVPIETSTLGPCTGFSEFAERASLFVLTSVTFPVLDKAAVTGRFEGILFLAVAAIYAVVAGALGRNRRA